MQFEVSVALNFIIAYLYNKLPRRRVNMLGEQMLEHLRIKFQGHWYPERPTKGSAYRSLRISKEKVDKVLINAAMDVGLDLQEILDTLPNDLTVWIDPGEVSYRIGEKGPVKILYEDERRLLRKNNNKDSLNSESSSDSEEREGSSQHASGVPIRPFNLDAQIFRPILDDLDTTSLLSTSINSLMSLSPSSPPTISTAGNNLNNNNNNNNNVSLNSSSGSSSSGNVSWTHTTPGEHALMPTISSPTIGVGGGGDGGTSPTLNSQYVPAATATAAFLNKTASTPVFSPQTFAQTKFGSLKSKHAGRRCQSKSSRMLPSEFSAYIKQKEQIQQSRILPINNNNNNNNHGSLLDNGPTIGFGMMPIRPPHYRTIGLTHYHQQQQQTQFTSTSPTTIHSHFGNTHPSSQSTLFAPLNNNNSSLFSDLPLRPNTLPLLPSPTSSSSLIDPNKFLISGNNNNNKGQYLEQAQVVSSSS